MAGRTAAQIAAQKKAAIASAAKRKKRTTGHDQGIKDRKRAAKAELGRAAMRKAVRGGVIGNIKAKAEPNTAVPNTEAFKSYAKRGPTRDIRTPATRAAKKAAVKKRKRKAS
jgi:hypothetical protein